jgi:hypothetical protein
MWQGYTMHSHTGRVTACTSVRPSDKAGEELKHAVGVLLDIAANTQAGGVLRASTQPTLNRRACMSIHAEVMPRELAFNDSPWGLLRTSTRLESTHQVRVSV